MTGGGNCDAAGIFGSVLEDPSSAGGTCITAPTVTLVAGVQYNCFVLAYVNEGGPSSCSTPAFSITTPSPDAVTNVATVSIIGTVWTASWTGAAAGAQSYKIKCIAVPGRRRQLLGAIYPACDSSVGDVFYSSVIDSSATGGSITIGTTSNKVYGCYVISYANSDGSGASTCSSVKGVGTAPNAPTVTSCSVFNSGFSVTFTPSLNAAGSYRVNCILTNPGGTCGTDGSFGDPVSSSDTTAVIGNVAVDTPYSCYIIAYTSPGAVGGYSCSSSLSCFWGE